MQTEKNQIDVKNTIEMIKLGGSLGKGFKDSKADGEINTADIVHLIPSFSLLGPAIEDADKIPLELKDMDSNESTQIITEVASAWGMTTDDPALLEKINVSLSCAMSIYKTYKVWAQ